MRLFVWLFLFIGIQCKKEQVNYYPFEIDKEKGEVIDSIRVDYSEKGIKSALLTAPKMYKLETNQVQSRFDEGVILNLYDDLGNPATRLTSKKAQLDHITNQMKAIDSVVVISPNTTLKADTMIWISNERKLLAFGRVSIKTKTDLVFGDSLYADDNIKQYRLVRVTGNFQVQK
ncbi:MAG: LPS export ABC transporter periplasmic protein LptC [Chitinophagales bacterium]|jgi:LPS export ABC transporter protein LptC|nr:LPS export ABC transporter periplasmic protein LptC [Chitinophagales bacterium]